MKEQKVREAPSFVNPNEAFWEKKTCKNPIFKAGEMA